MMPRPEPKIITAQQNTTGEHWQILATDSMYVITYQGQPVNIRTELHKLGYVERKYQKCAYANEGNCRAQVRKLNEIFDCEDFAYVKWPQ